MLQKPRIKFKLNDSFVEDYIGKQPEWGPLGYITYKRTYSRPLDSIPERCIDLAKQAGLSDSEEYWLTCTRVIEGVYNIQKAHCESLKLPWDNQKAQASAQEMFIRLWQFKWSPPGRGLWMMGTDILWEIGGASLYNCSHVSTAEIKSVFAEPFCYLMDMSMLGVGVGFNTKGADSVFIRPPKFATKDGVHVCEDSREGWIESTRLLLESFVNKRMMPSVFDYSQIRDKGEPIKRFGGTAPGPDPLYKCHLELVKLFYNGHIECETLWEERSYGREPSKLIFKNLPEFEPYKITSTHIVDTMNIVGKCVVSGGLRRSAELAIGEPDDEAFINLKQDQAKLEEYRWVSNNSIFAEVGMDYTKHAALTATNGEPGYLYLDNARRYGRMIDPPNYRDKLIDGYNPCFHPDAPILTPDGLKRAEDVCVSDTIWTGSKWSRVVKKWDSGVQPTFLYRTNAGYFMGTENHNVFSNGIKTPIKDVQLVDVARGTASETITCPAQAVVNGVALALVTLVEDKPALLMTNEDADAMYQPLLHAFIDLENKLDAPNVYVLKTTLSNEVFTQHKHRAIPTSLMHGNLNTVAGLLKGIFSGRGDVSKSQGTVSVKLYSATFAQQVQLLLSAVGVRSSLKEAQYYTHTIYRVVVSEDLARFASAIGFVQPVKQHLLADIVEAKAKHRPAETDESLISCAIISITSLGDSKVYDIMVEDEKHDIWSGGLHVGNCTEIGLESQELCNVPETYPSRHESYEDFQRTLKYAYLYGKTCTLMPTHNERTNAVQMRNRRIGLSQSGIVQNINKIGFREHMRWSDKGYRYICDLDEIYSGWLCVPKSIKKTSVKPSGSVSLLPGVTPGIHYPESEYYIRNIRIADTSPIIQAAMDAGYRCEPDTYAPNTVVVSFPVKEPFFVKAKTEVTLWEQMELGAQIQAYWADNGVSQTVTVQEHEKKDIANALSIYETRIKGISFLPLTSHGYKQAPYIPITKEEYETLSEGLKPLDLSRTIHEKTERYCDSDKCEISFDTPAEDSA